MQVLFCQSATSGLGRATISSVEASRSAKGTSPRIPLASGPMPRSLRGRGQFSSDLEEFEAGGVEADAHVGGAEPVLHAVWPGEAEARGQADDGPPEVVVLEDDDARGRRAEAGEFFEEADQVVGFARCAEEHDVFERAGDFEVVVVGVEVVVVGVALSCQVEHFGGGVDAYAV